MAKLNADNHLKASLTRLLPSAATQLKGPVQPQEDTMLKMSIPIAAAAPAMRGPLVAMNFFALSRLRSQLFWFACSCCWCELMAVMSSGWKQCCWYAHLVAYLACGRLLLIVSAGGFWLRSVHGGAYRFARCLKASGSGVSKVDETCSSSDWSRTSVVDGDW